nr:connectin-like [Aedes albopictus]
MLPSAMASTCYRHVTLVLLLLCVVTCPTESRNREKDLKKSKTTQLSQVPYSETVSSLLNLCSGDREMKLVCHCSPDDPHVKAQKANCWIFSKDLPRKDPNWLAFQTQTTVEQLKITVQKIGNLTYIPSDVLVTLKYLKQLTIEYGMITNLSEFAFGNLTELRNLTLHKNQIRLIHPFAFANHPFLEEINLERNEIVDLDKTALVNLPQLKKLNLDFNNLTILHADAFVYLTSLEELHVESNQVSLLSRESFKGLGNLRNLKLSANNIGYIGDTVFAELWSLQELHLDSNHIEKVSARAFDGLNNLRKLNLEHNRLTRLERGIFTGVPAVLTLNLNSNMLETITYNNFLPLMDNFVNSSAVLYVRDNKLMCDCRLLWLFDLHNATKNDHLRYTLQQIECTIEPNNNRGPVPHSIQNQLIDYSRPHDILGYDDSGADYEDPHRIPPAPYGDHQLIHRVGSSSGSSSYQFPATSNGYAAAKRQDHHYDRSIGPPPAVSQQPSKTINGKPLVTLMNLRKEDFPPCTKELDEPTELPLSRESIGMDPVYRSSLASASSDSGGSRQWAGTSLTAVVMMVCLLAAASVVAVVC